MKHLDIAENVSLIFGTAIGLSQIETILGIIILCVQLGIIIYKAILTIVKHIKNKNYDAIVDELKNTQKQLEELKDKVDEDGKKE